MLVILLNGLHEKKNTLERVQAYLERAATFPMKKPPDPPSVFNEPPTKPLLCLNGEILSISHESAISVQPTDRWWFPPQVKTNYVVLAPKTAAPKSALCVLIFDSTSLRINYP